MSDTKKFFLQQGTTFVPCNNSDLVTTEKLPVGNYIVQINPRNMDYELRRVDDFKMPAKLYGDTTKHTERIINTFLARHGNTGVLLNGTKGGGKTLLAKNVSIQLAARQNIPTILINEPFCDEKFLKFLQDIAQPTVVIFDEAEKTYNKMDDQNALLTLLDGVFSGKKMFVLTCNDRYGLSNYLTNRPGRIYYAFEFGGMSEDAIRGYCAENLRNMTNIDGIINIASFFREFNFDMLQSIVEEMNRYNETAYDVVRVLNIKPENDHHTTFKMALVAPEGVTVRLDGDTYEGSPIARTEVNVDVVFSTKDSEGNDESTYKSISFTQKDMVAMNRERTVFVYENDDKMRVTFTRIERPPFTFVDYTKTVSMI